MGYPETAPTYSSAMRCPEVGEIRRGIMAAANDLRMRHRWLGKNQDAIGLAILFSSMLGVFGNAWAYHEGAIPWWLCILVSMIWLSLLHELEHDLIHRIFFRHRPWVRHLMLATAWLFRPNTINPWIRHRMHLHHHKVSGTASDIEEIALSNGEPWGFKRFLMLWDSVISYGLRPAKMTQTLERYALVAGHNDALVARRVMRTTKLLFFPVTNVFYLFWHGLILFSIGTSVAKALNHEFLVGGDVERLVNVLFFLSVVLFIPNVMRSFCLYFVSSNIHYYGDIESGDLVRQTQVWTAPWTVPFNMFCFNFGGTHAIHHFVVREPFYIRQAIASKVYPVMRSNGVRFNDFATFRRANRWY
jgi:fatty acid desaturase